MTEKVIMMSILTQSLVPAAFYSYIPHLLSLSPSFTIPCCYHHHRRYESRLEEDAEDTGAITGKLKCLDALGRWEEAILMCTANLDKLRAKSSLTSRTAGAVSPPRPGGDRDRANSVSSLPSPPRSPNNQNISPVRECALPGGISFDEDDVESNSNPSPRSTSRRQSNGNEKDEDAFKATAHIKAAVIGARAAWSLNEWSLMDKVRTHAVSLLFSVSCRRMIA